LKLQDDRFQPDRGRSERRERDLNSTFATILRNGLPTMSSRLNSYNSHRSWIRFLEQNLPRVAGRTSAEFHRRTGKVQPGIHGAGVSHRTTRSRCPPCFDRNGISIWLQSGEINRFITEQPLLVLHC